MPVEGYVENLYTKCLVECLRVRNSFLLEMDICEVNLGIEKSKALAARSFSSPNAFACKNAIPGSNNNVIPQHYGVHVWML